LAGVGTGLYPSIPEACNTIIKTNPPQNPIRENSKKYEPYYKLFCDLYPGMKEGFQTLARL
ncbi:MAG: xylulokinase, partial [Oscillospiraceae bacterium]|nr:xylulokinase [Oscillospiraceae bacterium]